MSFFLCLSSQNTFVDICRCKSKTTPKIIFPCIDLSFKGRLSIRFVSDLYTACINKKHAYQVSIKKALELRGKFALQQTDRRKLENINMPMLCVIFCLFYKKGLHYILRGVFSYKLLILYYYFIQLVSNMYNKSWSALHQG